MKTTRLPSGKVQETAGMGGDKMLVDIDAFLDEDKPTESSPAPAPAADSLKSALSNSTALKIGNARLPSSQVKETPGMGGDRDSVDLGAFLDDLKEKDNTGGGGKNKKSLTQRHPRVSIAGVTDVQEAPKQIYHTHKGRSRRREPVTENQEREALRTMKEIKENQGLKGLIKFMKKNAGVGPNDEMAAVCCDFMMADMLFLDAVDPRHESDHADEIHDMGIDPFEDSGDYRPELIKRDTIISENIHVSILKALDKDCLPEHALSFTRLLAFMCIELSQITSQVKLLSKSKSKSKSMDSKYKSMSFDGPGPVSKRGVAKLQSWLSVDGDGRGEEVLSTILSVMAEQAEDQNIVCYCMIILAAATGVIGGRKESYITKHGLAQTVCDTLVFQSANWLCALYAMRALLGPCDGTGAWVSNVGAANGIVEILEALRRHVDRPQVTEPACKVILYLVSGHDSDTERRRNSFVDADGVTIIIKVLTTSDMFTDAHQFFDPKALSVDGKLGTAKRLKQQNELRLKASTFKSILTSLENVVGGTSKLADERRIKLIGTLCDEVCDLISSQQDVPEVQEAGFRVLASYCESTKKGISEAFVDDVNAAGATALACDVLFNKRLRKHPGPASAVFKLVSNMCSDQSQAAENCRTSFINGRVPKACSAILQGSMVSESGDPAAESLALAGIKVLHHLAAGLQPSDRAQVLRNGGPAAVTSVLTMHADRPQLVTAGADALRIMTLSTWRPPSRTNIKVPTLRDHVLGMNYGNSASKLGRELIIEAKAHIVICAALSRKQVDTNDQQPPAFASSGAAARANTGGGDVNPAIVGMVAACARFLGTLAMDSGPNADVARDALMAVNAHKLICAAMKPEGELKQASRAMFGCIEALRHFAGSGENSTSLLRREVMNRSGDELICSAMRAHSSDLEIQRSACCALRNLSFGGREEGDRRRTRLIKYEAHTRAATALRVFLAVESEPARMIQSTALHVAAVGLLRNLSFGGGKDSEARRAQLMKTKIDELILATIAVTTKAIGESNQRGAGAPPDLVECLEVCLVCLGNLMSGNDWQVENRRYDAATIKKVHIPVLEAMATYPRSSSMMFSCLVALSNFCMGAGTGADMVRALVVEHELSASFGHTNDAVSMCCKAMRRFMKNLMVAQAGIVFLANLCTATSKEANEIRAVVLAEGGHELVLYAMEYFPRKSDEAGAMIIAAGVAFLQNLTAGEGAHRPRQLLLSDSHLDFLPVLADIMDTHLGDQVITGHAIGLLGNLCIGWDDNDGSNNELPGAERRRQEIMGVDGVQLIANVLRSYRGHGNIMKGAFKAVTALCEGKGPNADKRREACLKLRIHVLICESLKNPNVVELRDEEIIEGGRLALGCIMYDSKGKRDRKSAILTVMADYELKMHTQWCICLRKGAKEYQPFSADNRFTANDEGDVFEEEGMAATLKSHKWSNLDKEIAEQGGDEDDDNASVDDFTLGDEGGGRKSGRRSSMDGEAKSWSKLHRRLSVKKDKKISVRSSDLDDGHGPSGTIGDEDDDDYRKSTSSRKSRSKSMENKSSSKSMKRVESMGASDNFAAMQNMEFGDDSFDGSGGGDNDQRKSRLSSIMGGIKRSTSITTKDFGKIMTGGSLNNGPSGTIGGEDEDDVGGDGGKSLSKKFSMPTLFLSKNQADAMVESTPEASMKASSPSVMFDDPELLHDDMGGVGGSVDFGGGDNGPKEPANVLDIEAIIAQHGGANDGPSGTIGGDDEFDDDNEGHRRRKSSSGRSRSRSHSNQRKESRRESTSGRKESRRESTSGRGSMDEDYQDRKQSRKSSSRKSKHRSSSSTPTKPVGNELFGSNLVGTIGEGDEEAEDAFQEHFLARKSSSRRNSTGGGDGKKASFEAGVVDDLNVSKSDRRSRGGSVDSGVPLEKKKSLRFSDGNGDEKDRGASSSGGNLLARLSSVRGKSSASSGSSSSARPQRSVSRFAEDSNGPTGTIDGIDDDEGNDEVGALLAGMAVGDDDGVTGEAGLEELFKKQRSSRAGKM
mmetsp:Transcript_25621/g.30352  ORF Transcript_25621/g.30352 Transcript_25621/m.30352 type:complete len:2015 (+) Transcript_25621:83-6127(+)